MADDLHKNTLGLFTHFLVESEGMPNNVVLGALSMALTKVYIDESEKPTKDDFLQMCGEVYDLMQKISK